MRGSGEQLTFDGNSLGRYCCPASLAGVSASKSCWRKSPEDLTSMAVEDVREADHAYVSKFSSTISQTATPPVNPAIPTATHLISSYRVGAPFSDFTGRRFLRGCLYADL